MNAPLALTYGIVSPKSAGRRPPRIAEFVQALADASRIAVTPLFADSYDALAAMLSSGKVSVAWLPPIPFIGLERAKLVVPLVEHHRGGYARFDAVLLVRKTSTDRTLYGLRGKRAAWVDPLSAAGYVLPRIQLAALGIDPRHVFASERFYGTHEAAIRAVIDDKADVTGTFARVDENDAIVRGGWSDIDGAEQSVRVCARFGAIPADVTAAHRDVPPDARARLADALVALSCSTTAPLLKDIFGLDEFRPWTGGDYEPLRRAMSDASARGLLDAVDTPTEGDGSRESNDPE
jgi:phosphonate transport system substrate-binding protein